MTTKTTVPPATCKECSSFTGPFWNGFCPSCLDDACLNGDGERFGLPAVPQDEYDDTILWAHDHNVDHTPHNFVNDCILCHVNADICSECDIPEEMMDPEDEDAHLIVDGIILIGCEGYHTTFFRICNQEMRG